MKDDRTRTGRAMDDLATFLHDVSYEDIPSEVREKSKAAFLDWLCVTLAGARHNAAGIVRNTVAAFGGEAHSSLVGFGGKTSAPSAALLNGFSSHVLDFDDVQMSWIGHPSVTVVPAILALGEWLDLPGRDVLTAYVVGQEAQGRIGRAVMPSHYEKGWHSTGTIGVFGAAAACAKLLKLDPGKILHALGAAATQASGMRRMFGSMCKPLHPAKASSDGLLAALLARDGFTGNPEFLTGEGGFADLYSEEYHEEPLHENLGETWDVTGIDFKIHASCYSTHGLIRCGLASRNEALPFLHEIESVSCRVADQAARIANIQKPQTELEAKFCQAYCLAVALRDGKAASGQFTPEMLQDDWIRDLLAKTTVRGDVNLPYGHAVVRIRLRNGKVIETRTGVDEQQPSAREWLNLITDKALDLLGDFTEADTVHEIAKAAQSLDQAGSIRDVMSILPITAGQSSA